MAGELYTTYDQVGIKEDVSDVISMITPTKTPFQSSIKTEGVDNTLFEWQEDAIRDPASNAQVEGFEAVDTARTPTTMQQNRTQIYSETFKISRTAERVKKYGRKSEIARELVKTGKALKLDLEYTLVGLDQAAVAGSESAARKMASVFPQIHADTTTNADGGAGAADAIDETYITGVLEKVYNKGGDVSILMIKPADAKIVAAFAAASGRTRDVGDSKKLVNAVDIYVTPYGVVKIVLNRLLKTTQALFYSPENWKLAVLDNWFREKLAKTGDSERHMLVGEFSVKHLNQRASGLLENLS